MRGKNMSNRVYRSVQRNCLPGTSLLGWYPTIPELLLLLHLENTYLGWPACVVIEGLGQYYRVSAQ